jgi:hypothetical protein
MHVFFKVLGGGLAILTLLLLVTHVILSGPYL